MRPILQRANCKCRRCPRCPHRRSRSLEQANTGGPFDFKSSSDFFAYPSFTQPFLWPGKRALAGAVASAQAEVVGRQYDSLVIAAGRAAAA